MILGDLHSQNGLPLSRLSECPDFAPNLPAELPKWGHSCVKEVDYRHRNARRRPTLPTLWRYCDGALRCAPPPLNMHAHNTLVWVRERVAGAKLWQVFSRCRYLHREPLVLCICHQQRRRERVQLRYACTSEPKVPLPGGTTLAPRVQRA